MVGEAMAKAEAQLDKSPDVVDREAIALSTGSTLLNLACTGSGNGGFVSGKFYLFVGDASAGKTFLAMTCLAEACLDPDFSQHRLIYDNIEDGCLLNIKELFNEDLESRIEPPRLVDGEPIYSTTVEDFYFHLDDAVESGRPFIYVLDSMDALTSEADAEKFKKLKKASRSNTEVAGSYGMDKAKRNSEGLRRAVSSLRGTKSILIVLCQTRDNVGFGFAEKTRAGGRALKFYATVEIWAAIRKTIKKYIRGKNRQVGVKVLWKVKKNRITGLLHEVEFDIYPSFGVDDVGSCVDYLVSEGHWKSKGSKIDASDIGPGFCVSREKLIAEIESYELIDRVRGLVCDCWNDIQAEGGVKRQNRYKGLIQ
jgi:RecA/RadA recombinase